MVQDLELLVRGSNDLLTSQKVSKFSTNKKFVVFIASGIMVILLAVASITVLEKKPDCDDLWTKKLPQNCGQRTNRSEFPWIVSILRDRGNGISTIWYLESIVGTLISKRYVLTGAYTLVHRFKFPNSTTKFIVLLDISNLPRSMIKRGKIENYTYRNVVNEKSHIAAGKGTTTVGNSIALLWLDSDVEFIDGIQPICLPGVVKSSGPISARQFEIVVHVKRKFGLTVETDFARCIPGNCTKLEHGNNDDRICTLNANPELQVLHGAEGSPLSLTVDETGIQRAVQYGVKHSIYCAKELYVFTNVCYHMKWILETIEH